MKYGWIRRAAFCLLAGGLLLSGSGLQTEAAAAGMTGPESKTGTPASGEENLNLMCGGIWQVLTESNSKISGEGQPGTAEASARNMAGAPLAADADSSRSEAAETENEYEDLAIANVRRYVNVRREATTESSIVGKIYNGAVAQILETVEGKDGQWFRIVSGNVEGYIKSEYFLYGQAAAEAIDDYVTRYATVIVSRLNVRKEPDITSKRVGFVDSGEKLLLLEKDGDWLKVQYTDERTGYVAAEFTSIMEEFVYAKTLEEEAAEIAARRALEERQRVPEEQAAEKTEITVVPPSGNYGSNAELRDEIVAYAMQFLGNRYVHGGRSLVTGTDCSGFTSLIYAEFGYSISRTPAGQLSGAGREVAFSEIQPGDIICYGSKKCSHVAMYIGDGKIIHAANSRKGVIISGTDFGNILGVKNVID